MWASCGALSPKPTLVPGPGVRPGVFLFPAELLCLKREQRQGGSSQESALPLVASSWVFMRPFLLCFAGEDSGVPGVLTFPSGHPPVHGACCSALAWGPSVLGLWPAPGTVAWLLSYTSGCRRAGDLATCSLMVAAVSLKMCEL